MGKYDGISKVDAVVRTAEEPAEKKSRGYLFSLAVRTVCAAAIVALLFLRKVDRLSAAEGRWGLCQKSGRIRCRT